MRHLPSGRITQSMRMLFIFIFISSCGEYKPHIYYQTKEIKDFVFLFETEYMFYTSKHLEIKNLNISIAEINSEKIKGTILGFCKKSPFKTPIIILNKLEWETMNYWQKKQLIYHELGHCVLNLKHSKDGLMQPFIIYWKEYRDYEDYYLNLLFNHGQ